MSRLALLPDDIMRLIVGFGGMNKHAEEALRAIQRRWRVARNIARRRAAYHIQDAFHGLVSRFPWYFTTQDVPGHVGHDETGIPRIAYLGSTAYGLLYVTG